MVEDLPEDHRKDERTASNPSHRNKNSKSGIKQAICPQKEEEEEVKVDRLISTTILIALSHSLGSKKEYALR
jgi:hypothetical protein